MALFTYYFQFLLFSQIGLNPAVDPANPGNYSQTRISQDPQATSLEGKIASEGGVTPPNTVAVLQCGTSERGRITTDRNAIFCCGCRFCKLTLLPA